MEGMRFAKSHEWVRLEGDRAVVGISDYAQNQLGDVVFIELPQSGDQLQQAGQLGTIESTKAASEVYSPISGKVVEVNTDLINNPQWINEAPYDKGWLVKIKPANLSEFEQLMDEDAYKAFVAQESH